MDEPVDEFDCIECGRHIIPFGEKSNICGAMYEPAVSGGSRPREGGMARIVCTSCGTFFHPLRNGVCVEEGRPIGGDEWAPYKLWIADAYTCRNCGKEVISGFALEPLAEHYMPDYAAKRARRQVRVFVRDCP